MPSALERDTSLAAPKPVASPDFLKAASFSSPVFLANFSASSIVTRWRMAASTSASGRLAAGLNSTTRPAIRVLGATSTASVLRLFCSESLVNRAARNLALLYGAVPAAGDGTREMLAAVSIFRPSLSATGFRLSACSYTVLVNASAISEYFLAAFCFFSSAATSFFTSSSGLTVAGLSEVTVRTW